VSVDRAPDYLQLAARCTREEFATACPFFFLLTTARFERPRRAQNTGVFSPQDTDTTTHNLGDSDTKSASVSPVILAVRKVQASFPSMITVGRTLNNDLVVPDVLVSRFHAFFRPFDDRLELSDAGSRNGTWVGQRRLAPKGPPQIVVLSDSVRFARHEFVLLDAATCWDRLRPSPPRS
jgi:hypothetical protein